MPTSDYKILIAEDESAMRDALVSKLGKEGFNVLGAQDGEDAFEQLIKEKPDLLMLDILMPKMDGLSLVKMVRREGDWGKDVPIVMLTNLSDPESVSEAANYGVYDFLVKTDWRLDDVVNLVKTKLNIT